MGVKINPQQNFIDQIANSVKGYGIKVESYQFDDEKDYTRFQFSNKDGESLMLDLAPTPHGITVESKNPASTWRNTVLGEVDAASPGMPLFGSVENFARYVGTGLTSEAADVKELRRRYKNDMSSVVSELFSSGSQDTHLAGKMPWFDPVDVHGSESTQKAFLTRKKVFLPSAFQEKETAVTSLFNRIRTAKRSDPYHDLRGYGMVSEDDGSLTLRQFTDVEGDIMYMRKGSFKGPNAIQNARENIVPLTAGKKNIGGVEVEGLYRAQPQSMNSGLPGYTKLDTNMIGERDPRNEFIGKGIFYAPEKSGAGLVYDPKAIYGNMVAAGYGTHAFAELPDDMSPYDASQGHVERGVFEKRKGKWTKVDEATEGYTVEAHRSKAVALYRYQGSSGPVEVPLMVHGGESGTAITGQPIFHAPPATTIEGKVSGMPLGRATESVKEIFAQNPNFGVDVDTHSMKRMGLSISTAKLVHPSTKFPATKSGNVDVPQVEGRPIDYSIDGMKIGARFPAGKGLEAIYEQIFVGSSREHKANMMRLITPNKKTANKIAEYIQTSDNIDMETLARKWAGQEAYRETTTAHRMMGVIGEAINALPQGRETAEKYGATRWDDWVPTNPVTKERMEEELSEYRLQAKNILSEGGTQPTEQEIEEYVGKSVAFEPLRDDLYAKKQRIEGIYAVQSALHHTAEHTGSAVQTSVRGATSMTRADRNAAELLGLVPGGPHKEMTPNQSGWVSAANVYRLEREYQKSGERMIPDSAIQVDPKVLEDYRAAITSGMDFEEAQQKFFGSERGRTLINPETGAAMPTPGDIAAIIGPNNLEDVPVTRLGRSARRAVEEWASGITGGNAYSGFMNTLGDTFRKSKNVHKVMQGIPTNLSSVGHYAESVVYGADYAITQMGNTMDMLSGTTGIRSEKTLRGMAQKLEGVVSLFGRFPDFGKADLVKTISEEAQRVKGLLYPQMTRASGRKVTPGSPSSIGRIAGLSMSFVSRFIGDQDEDYGWLQRAADYTKDKGLSLLNVAFGGGNAQRAREFINRYAKKFDTMGEVFDKHLRGKLPGVGYDPVSQEEVERNTRGIVKAKGGMGTTYNTVRDITSSMSVLGWSDDAIKKYMDVSIPAYQTYLDKQIDEIAARGGERSMEMVLKTANINYRKTDTNKDPGQLNLSVLGKEGGSWSTLMSSSSHLNEGRTMMKTLANIIQRDDLDPLESASIFAAAEADIPALQKSIGKHGLVNAVGGYYDDDSKDYRQSPLGMSVVAGAAADVDPQTDTRLARTWKDADNKETPIKATGTALGARLGDTTLQNIINDDQYVAQAALLGEEKQNQGLLTNKQLAAISNVVGGLRREGKNVTGQLAEISKNPATADASAMYLRSEERKRLSVADRILGKRGKNIILDPSSMGSLAGMGGEWGEKSLLGAVARNAGLTGFYSKFGNPSSPDTEAGKRFEPVARAYLEGVSEEILAPYTKDGEYGKVTNIPIRQLFPDWNGPKATVNLQPDFISKIGGQWGIDDAKHSRTAESALEKGFDPAIQAQVGIVYKRWAETATVAQVTQALGGGAKAKADAERFVAERAATGIRPSSLILGAEGQVVPFPGSASGLVEMPTLADVPDFARKLEAGVAANIGDREGFLNNVVKVMEAGFKGGGTQGDLPAIFAEAMSAERYIPEMSGVRPESVISVRGDDEDEEPPAKPKSKSKKSTGGGGKKGGGDKLPVPGDYPEEFFDKAGKAFSKHFKHTIAFTGQKKTMLEYRTQAESALFQLSVADKQGMGEYAEYLQSSLMGIVGEGGEGLGIPALLESAYQKSPEAVSSLARKLRPMTESLNKVRPDINELWRNIQGDHVTVTDQAKEALAKIQAGEGQFGKSLTSANMLHEFASTFGAYDKGAASGKMMTGEEIRAFAEELKKVTPELKKHYEVLRDGNTSVEQKQEAQRGIDKIEIGLQKMRTAPRAERLYQDLQNIDADRFPQEAQSTLDEYEKALRQESDLEGREAALDKEGKWGSRVSGAVRNLIGGWGMMYMGHLASMPFKAMGAGFQEYEKYGAETQAGIGGHLPGAGQFQSMQMEIDRNKLRTTGTGFGAFEMFTSRQSAMTRDVGASLIGGAAVYGLATYASAPVGALLGIGSGALASIAPWLAGAAVVGTAAYQQYQYAQNPDRAIYQNVTGRLAGTFNPNWSTMLVPEGTQTAKDIEYAIGQMYAGNQENEYVAREDAASPSARAQEVGFDESFGEGTKSSRGRTYSLTQEQLAKSFQAMGTDPRFANYDPTMVSEAATRLWTGKNMSDENIKKLVGSQMRGVNPQSIGSALLSGFGKQITAEAMTGVGGAELLVADAGLNLYQAQNVQTGAGVMGSLSIPYRGFMQSALGGSMISQASAMEAYTRSANLGFVQTESALAQSAYERGQTRDNKFIEAGEMSPERAREIHRRQQREQMGLQMFDQAETLGLNADEYRQVGQYGSQQELALAQSAINMAPGANALGWNANRLDAFARQSVQNQGIASMQLSVGNRFAAVTGNSQENMIASTMSTYAGANYMSRLTNFDPLAIAQLAMQSPGSSPIQQMVTMDVNKAGEITGLPWGTTSLNMGNIPDTQVAQTVWGGNQQSAVVGAMTGGFTDPYGQTQYGQRAAQWYMRDLSRQASQASFGYQIKGMDLALAFQTGVGLDQYHTVDPRSGNQFNLRPGGMWGVEDDQRSLQHEQQLWQFDTQRKQMDMQDRFFYEERSMQSRQMGMQRGWAREDYGYQDSMRSMQWGWKKEDFEENVRFMTGRDRKLAERQMRRDTTVHDVEGDQIDKSRSRQESLWKLEDERFETSKRQYEEQKRFQLEQMNKQEEFYYRGKELQDAQLELTRAYFIEQQKLQREAAGAQMHFAEEMRKAEDDLLKLAQTEEDRMAKLGIAKTLEVDMINTLIGGINYLIAHIPSAFKNGLPIAGWGGGGGGPINPGDPDDPAQPTSAHPGRKGGDNRTQDWGQVGTMRNRGRNLDDWGQVGTMGDWGQVGTMNSWDNTAVTYSDGTKAADQITVTINIGNEKLGDFVIDRVTQEINL